MWRSDTIFTSTTLPSLPLLELPSGSTTFEDLSAVSEHVYYYMLGVYKGGKSEFSNLITADTAYSDFGPGPLALAKGNMLDVGYFGQVTDAELITASALSSAVGVNQGSLISGEIGWLKFALDNRILFVAKKRIRVGLISTDLVAANVVSGDRQINIGNHTFKLSILSGQAKSGSHSPGSSSTDGANCFGSEWNRLMYRSTIPSTAVSPTGISAEGITFGEFVNIPAASLDVAAGGNGNYTICSEYATAGNPVERGAFSVVGSYRHTSAVSSDRGWRPVLELIVK